MQTKTNKMEPLIEKNGFFNTLNELIDYCDDKCEKTMMKSDNFNFCKWEYRARMLKYTLNRLEN